MSATRRTTNPPVESTATLAAITTRLAEAIAEAESMPADSQPRAILFRIGALRLALPLTSVREVVIPPLTLTRVPRAPEALLGVMNLRGRVVLVVDLLQALAGPLAARVGVPVEAREPGADLATGRLVILVQGRREIALLTSAVEGIAPVPERQSGVTLLDPAEIGQALDALVA